MPTLMDGVMLVAAVVVVIVGARRGWFRLEDRLDRPAIVQPAGAVVLFLTLFLLGPAGFEAARALLEPTPDGTIDVRTAAGLNLGRYSAQGLGVLVFVMFRLRAGVPGSGRARAAALGAAALIVTWPFTYLAGRFAGAVFTMVRGEPSDVIAHDTLRLIVEADPDFWLALLIAQVLVAAPIVEEVMYRGLVQDALRRIGLTPLGAVAVTSAVFAFMHASIAEPHAVVALFVLSLGFGWIYERTGRLTAPIVMHALFNAVNLVLALGTR